ncbi:hypothetical protein BN1723_007365 [Verticillium longisporum]|uniref:C2H2-type domain-containing protein n=1 Tax=Verticillium longisporum TaxID=100787 RepID=A0A0G4NL21_VERLO|nr:hypothetical protein BN1723_007365 [Verticillium longisporum]
MQQIAMSDVRALLRQQRAARRIDHPFAAYSDAGKLLCTLCHEAVKAESLWDAHLRSSGHTDKSQKQQASQKTRPTTIEEQTNGTHKRKHDSDSDDEDATMVDATARKKRSRNDMNTPARSGSESSSDSAGGTSRDRETQATKDQTLTPPTLNRRTSTTPVQGGEMLIPSRPARVLSPKPDLPNAETSCSKAVLLDSATTEEPRYRRTSTVSPSVDRHSPFMQQIAMSDVRALLRQQRAARRIDHPFAAYSDAGKLLCTLCHEAVKAESLWDAHLRSSGHTDKSQKKQASQKTRTTTIEEQTNGTHKRKHDSDSDDEDATMVDATARKKRSRNDMNTPARSADKGPDVDAPNTEQEDLHDARPRRRDADPITARDASPSRRHLLYCDTPCNMVDIFEIAPQDQAARPAPALFAYAGQEARIVRYQHLLSKLASKDEGEGQGQGPAGVQVNWLPQEDTVDVQRRAPSIKSESDGPLSIDTCAAPRTVWSIVVHVGCGCTSDWFCGYGCGCGCGHVAAVFTVVHYLTLDDESMDMPTSHLTSRQLGTEGRAGDAARC